MFFCFFGHNSAPWQFWEAPLGGNSSYRPPGAFLTNILEIKPQENQHVREVSFDNIRFFVRDQTLWFRTFPAVYICSFWARTPNLRSKNANFGSQKGKIRKNDIRTINFDVFSSNFRIPDLSSCLYVQFFMRNPMFRSKMSNSGVQGGKVRKNENRKIRKYLEFYA